MCNEFIYLLIDPVKILVGIKSLQKCSLIAKLGWLSVVLMPNRVAYVDEFESSVCYSIVRLWFPAFRSFMFNACVALNGFLREALHDWVLFLFKKCTQYFGMIMRGYCGFRMPWHQESRVLKRLGLRFINNVIKIVTLYSVFYYVYCSKFTVLTGNSDKNDISWFILACSLIRLRA